MVKFLESKYLSHQSWLDGVLTIPWIDDIISFWEVQNFLSKLIFFLPKLLWHILFLVCKMTRLRAVETRLISSWLETGLISSLLICLFLKNPYLAYHYLYFLPWWLGCFIQRREFFIFCWTHFWAHLLLPLLFIDTYCLPGTLHWHYSENKTDKNPCHYYGA